MTPGQNADDDSAAERSRFLRPVGYVAPDPVVRPLGVLGLHLGNRHAAMPERHEYTFDAVLTVSAEGLPLTTHHRPLTDGEGNEWSAFADAVDTGRRLAGRENAVLVNCHAGVSRSTAVLATTVAAETDRSMRASLRIVESARPSALPHPALLELGVYYLAARE